MVPYSIAVTRNVVLFVFTHAWLYMSSHLSDTLPKVRASQANSVSMSYYDGPEMRWEVSFINHRVQLQLHGAETVCKKYVI